MEWVDEMIETTNWKPVHAVLPQGEQTLSWTEPQTQR